MSNFPHKVNFKAKQAEFSAYIRNPIDSPCPSDIQPERMQMYRELFFNNVESFLSSNFPVLHKILSKQQWQQLAQDFFAKHHCTSPYFSEIPEEFILYLQNERQASEDDYPFMLELAHYEWVEMALSISQESIPELKPAHTIELTQKISLSPLAWLLAYQYPVHKISSDYLPTQKPEQAHYLVVYRNQEDEVKFIELAPMSFYLLQVLHESEVCTVADCIEKTLIEHSTETLRTAALEALQQFLNKQIILAI